MIPLCRNMKGILILLSMKTVIRVEHKSGKGLWSAQTRAGYSIIDRHSKYYDIVIRHVPENGFPTPSDDEKLKNYWTGDTNKWFFAFKSLDQLKTALTNEELKECINKLNFKVYTLDVTNYIESDYQVIFTKKSIVEKKDITFMFL